MPAVGIQRIADTLIGWSEAEKLSRIVDHAELKKNDYNISPSRYIHTSDAETYRPIAEIVEELAVIDKEARETDQALQTILKQMGVGA
ncbi:N-6 DNA methylase [Acidithiobacillus thiooxidans]|uniref:N-6 DNA methylase n=1 Tax=Acidithiobacillus thiooxidans TaxID=930 RepID=UPI002DF731C6|nr:N-6 DNA methylase [Acidithiobacillus thiooxidans]